jgi:predicted transcriptional regulator
VTIESLLSDRKPRTAMEIARLTQKDIDDVYERLVHLEAEGVVVLTYVRGCTKTKLKPYQWVMR